MKILKNKAGLFSLLAIFITSILLTSCEQDSINLPIEVGAEENQKIMHALCKEVHDCSHIEILEDAIIYDKCMHMDKNNILEYLTILENGIEEEPVMRKIPHPLDAGKMIEIQDNDVQYYDEQNNAIIEERQRITGFDRFAKNSEVTDLKYYIFQSARDCHPNNEKYINEATGYWSSIPNCKVRFSYTSDYQSADIVFGCDSDPFFSLISDIKNLEDGTQAQATFPDLYTRKVGKYISINDAYTTNSSLRKGLLIHEIGHCLGLAHTDDSSFGIQVSHTPNNDGTSLMNSWDVGKNHFNKADLKMVRLLWPEKLEKPTNFSLKKEGNQVRIQFKNPNVGTGPYDNISVRHWYNGSIQASRNWTLEADANGNYNFLMPTNYPSGVHYFTIQGGSHLIEVMSPHSGWKYIII